MTRHLATLRALRAFPPLKRLYLIPLGGHYRLVVELRPWDREGPVGLGCRLSIVNISGVLTIPWVITPVPPTPFGVGAVA
jgi:hypothetical protein